MTVTTTVDDPDGLLDEVTVAVTMLDDDGRDVLLDVYDPLVLDPVDAIGTPAPAWAYEAGRTVTLTGEVAADAPTGDL